jgi:hypothetical protein
MRIPPLDGDPWLERLIRLRRVHLQQWLTLHDREIHYRQALTQQFQRERQSLTGIRDLALLIQQQTRRIEALNQEKQSRKQALRTYQAQEIYELLLLKIQTQSIARQTDRFEG